MIIIRSFVRGVHGAQVVRDDALALPFSFPLALFSA